MGGIGSGRKKATVAVKPQATVANKASGRMPAWATTKPKKAYVVAMRAAGLAYSNEGYTPYRKALKAGKTGVSAPAKVTAKLPGNKKKFTSYDLVIADASGSMIGTRQQQALSGMNEHLDNIKESEKTTGIKTVCSFMTFANRGAEKIVRNGVPSAKITHIKNSEYKTGGMTALNDAIVSGLSLLEKQTKGKKNTDVTLTIFTDGMENVSKTSVEDTKKAISAAEEKGWTVAFMGEGSMSPYAKTIGVQDSNTLSYATMDSGMSSLKSARLKKSTNLSRGVQSNVGFFAK